MDGGCPMTASPRGVPPRTWTHPIRVVMMLGMCNSIHVGLQVGLVDRHQAVSLQAIIAAMLFCGVVIETGSGIVDTIVATQTAGAGLISPFCAAPSPRTSPRAASNCGVAGLAKNTTIWQSQATIGTHETNRGGRNRAIK